MHHLTSQILREQKQAGSTQKLQAKLIQREQQHNPAFQMLSEQDQDHSAEKLVSSGTRVPSWISKLLYQH